MKSAGFIALLVAHVACASSITANPIGKVISMLSDMEQKIIKEGEADQKTYAEYSKFCQESSSNLKYEIKTGKHEVSDLEAAIEKADSDIAVYSEDINTQAGVISDNEAELKAATDLRAKEQADFKAEEKSLISSKDTLERAIGIVTRQMEAGASFAQLKGTQGVLQAVSAMVEASSISTADGSSLAALLQSSANSDDADEDAEAGPPAASVYESNSGVVVDTMNGLLEKAENQLAELRKDEMNAANAYALAKQSLEAKIKSATDSMADAKKDLAAAGEAKATAEGDLTVTKKDLAADIANLEELHHDCMEKASNFEEETKSRAEELKALATAKKVINEKTGGAAEQTYGLEQVSFVQVKAKAKTGMRTRSMQSSDALHIVRKLARAGHSTALSQLASRMEVLIRSATRSGSSDPFGKVRGLIEDMISKLEEEAESDATQKAFCDKELKENKEKKEDKEEDIEEMTASIDSMTIKSQALQEEVASLQKELAKIAGQQATMTKLRQEEKAHFDANKPEMEQGLEGVKMALKVLRDYYGQDDASSGGAAGGIIGLLEVCESDFQKGLAEMIAEEEAAVAEYEAQTKENEVSVATKEEDVKYKTKEYTSLDKAVAETTSDKEGVSEELAAVKAYLANLMKQCVAKPDSYEERAKRREEEIAGLKEAYDILENEAFIQVGSKRHRLLRGAALQAGGR
mmetsp:Transcript_96733/g.167908  ORF Transcript_96733/g.167908 Transcript_96733/m.167908 type:complete len:693 (+) Transcript_96733:73-2151(+)